MPRFIEARSSTFIGLHLYGTGLGISGLIRSAHPRPVPVRLFITSSFAALRLQSRSSITADTQLRGRHSHGRSKSRRGMERACSTSSSVPRPRGSNLQVDAYTSYKSSRAPRKSSQSVVVLPCRITASDSQSH